MQQLLNTLQQPSSLRKEIVTLKVSEEIKTSCLTSIKDTVLINPFWKALLHLNAARAEISEIFFGVPAGARMQIISQDRELVRERELRQKVTFQEVSQLQIRRIERMGFIVIISLYSRFIIRKGRKSSYVCCWADAPESDNVVPSRYS